MHIDCLKTSHFFRWIIVTTVHLLFIWEAQGVMKQPATRESDNLRYFGSINGREYYIGKEEATWTESIENCLHGQLRLLEFDENSEIYDFLSLSPSSMSPFETSVRIWTSGVSSPEDTDILWSGRDVFASATDLDFSQFNLFSAAEDHGCISLVVHSRPFGRRPIPAFQAEDCQAPATYFCFATTADNGDMAKFILKDTGDSNTLRIDNSLGTIDKSSKASSKAAEEASAAALARKEDACKLKEAPKIDLFKPSGLTTDELLALVKLRHEHAFHLALDDEPPEQISPEDYKDVSLKDSFIDILFKIVKRLLPDNYGQYAYLNIARRIVLMYYKWIGDKRFPAKLDTGKWKTYRADFIQCYNNLDPEPIKYKYKFHKITHASGSEIGTHRVQPYSDNDIFLDTLWYVYSASLGACTKGITRMQKIRWVREMFLDFDADFLSAFKDIWLGEHPLEAIADAPDYMYMELGTQVLFGDFNYIACKYNLAALSVITHKRNHMDHLMVVRPL